MIYIFKWEKQLPTRRNDCNWAPFFIKYLIFMTVLLKLANLINCSMCQGVSRTLVENSRTLRLPTYLHERLGLIRNAKTKLDERGITPSVAVSLCNSCALDIVICYNLGCIRFELGPLCSLIREANVTSFHSISFFITCVPFEHFRTLQNVLTCPRRKWGMPPRY